MAKLKLLSTIFSKLGSLTKNNGQIIVTRDSKSLYVDLEGERIEITDWIDVDTEESLLAILTPLTNKYYYTKDTNKIWRYINSEWECLNTSVNDLTPTYTESSTLVKLSSGEKLSVSFGKISKAITDLISHIGDSVKHITPTERTNWGKAYTHSQSTHARTDATKVEKSSTNGNIKINGTETTVYTHPGSGTNPHGTTKSDVGLGNVGNFKAVSTVSSQGLSDTEKSNARANIGAQVAGSYASSNHNHDDKYQAKGSYASASHTHDDRYYTESEMNTKLGGKVDLSRDGINKAINKLDVGASTPTDADYYLSQYVSGGTTTTTYHRRPMSALWNYIKGKADKVYSVLGHKHTKAEITDFPTSMPASDVYAWAKASSKPSYTKSEVGLGNVDNTADANKSVKYATSAGSAPANGGTATASNYVKVNNTENKNVGRLQYFQKSGDDTIMPSKDWYSLIRCQHPGYSNGYWQDIAFPFVGGGRPQVRQNVNGTKSAWKELAYKSDVPSSLPANGGNSATVNGHTVNSDVPANAKFTDTTYALATTSANGLMSKDMVSKLNNCRREVWSSTTPSIDLNDHWIYEY